MQVEKRRNTLFIIMMLTVPVITILYGQALEVSGVQNLRIWNWINLLWLLPAVPLIYWQSAAGLPDCWPGNVPARQKLWIPLITGIIFGLLDVLVIKIILHPEPYQSLPPFLQPFPYSLFLFSSGALEIEIWYRLLPITLVLYLLRKTRKESWTPVAFMLLAVLTSLREPLEQWVSGPAWLTLYAFISGWSMNFLEAIRLQKAGFGAAWILRMGHYLVWHIALGIYVQWVELAR